MGVPVGTIKRFATGKGNAGKDAVIAAMRRTTYGDPAASMAVVARRWSITLGRSITPAEVLLCLIDLKLTRLGHDPGHQDSILDVAGYAAVLQELER